MLEIRLLGRFQVCVKDTPVVLPSRLAQSILAYLLVHRTCSHRREKLAGLFWLDKTETNARRSLRQELWRLRKILNPDSDLLLSDDLSIGIDPHCNYWLDVAQFEETPVHPSTGDLMRSLDVYRGELLPDFYDEWVMVERERLRGLYANKMQLLMERLVAEERWASVLEWGDKWLVLDRSAEGAYRALMLAYGARGEMSRVAALYQRCVNALVDDLGVEPSDETRALYDGLIKGVNPSERMVPLQPAGTVTFLFSDIEGSTRLLERLRDQYATILVEQRDLLRAAFKKWNGREIDTQGDSFFVVFTRAADAANCVVEAQRNLAAHKWTANATVRVRMGLHTGEPMMGETGYIGLDVHRAARIGDAGHGGQVLLSQTTHDLIAHDLPQEVTIRDLGEHQLKDMRYPTRVFQLVIAGLPADFPPLRTRFSGSEAPAPGEPPFKGLEYFDVTDADLFFGRELLTAKLIGRLRESAFLSVVVGASGSGKSSIVRAGVIPALKKGEPLADGVTPPLGSSTWDICVLTPTAHPLTALATALTRDSESVTATATLIDDLAREPRSLSLYVHRRLNDNHPHLLLVVDQFEELFTLCHDEFEREAFIDNLLTAVTRNGINPLTLIIAMRADFYAHLAQYPELRDAVARQQEYIGPMSAEELRRAIEEPSRRGHWEFELGLVDLILRDVGNEPGGLPLLSHALLETWKRRSGRTLTLKGYAECGGVRGAIAQTAETTFQELSLEQQTIARNVFLRLTELGEGTEDTRRRATLHELYPSEQDETNVRAVLQKLADARLITLSQDSAEVAHEALIREWHRLREWLNADREGLRLHRRLADATQEWELVERDAGALYRGAHLAQAQEWAAVNPATLNDQERAFLQASVDLAQREEAEREAQRQREMIAAQKLAEVERRRANILRWVAIGSALLLVVMIGLALFSFSQRQEAVVQRDIAENERRIAFARELSVNAVNNLTIDPERSILLALQAVSVSTAGGKPVLREAEEALHRAVQASRVQLTLRGHTAGLNDVAFSPDGKRLATASNDKSAKIWDAATGQELLTLCCHADTVYKIVFSPDGKWLATASGDKTAKIWDAATGKELLTLRGHTDVIRGIAFSPDSTRVATGSLDKTAKIWDAATGKELLTLIGHTGGVAPVAFSPDGTRLATGSWADEQEHTTKVWDAVSGKLLITLKGHVSTIWGVVFSPDGKRLATGSGDATAKIWDSTSGQLLLTIFAHSVVESLAYSRDGTRLATGSSSGTPQVWDAATGELLLTMPGHTATIWGVSLSPDSTRLATASTDGTARVWDITPSGSREQLTIAAHTLQARYIAYSPDGTRIATAGQDKIAKVWDAVTGEELLTLSGHTDAVNGIAFSPDGSRLATVSLDQTAKIWDAATGKQLVSISTKIYIFPQGPRVAFSPDGQRIVTPGADNSAKVWDSITGKELLTLCCHTAPVWAVAFSPDGTRVVTGGWDRVAKVWDAAIGKELVTLSGHTDTIFAAAFSPDGQRIATASTDGTTKVWDAATGKVLLTLSGAAAGVAFSPDGMRVASASPDGRARVWDVATASGQSEQPLTLYNPNGAFVTGVAFSPDGKRLAASSNDGTARIYALPLDDIIAIAKSRVTRALTNDECQKYLHVDKCPGKP